MVKKSLIYTKGGDKGQTSLIGGTRVSKHNDRLEAYGTIDELSSNIGMIWSYNISNEDKEFLWRIQNKLFVIGAYLATDDSVSDMRNKLNAETKDIEALELKMDEMEFGLPELKNFVLPGGHPAIASCHIVRTICRRAERRILKMSEQYQIEEWVIRYINRLSDYFFVLARYLTNYFKVEEIPWRPELD